MARRNRIKSGNLYSVVTRINNWRDDFQDEQLCELFLFHLQQVKLQTGIKIYAFVIMPTHVHLCIEISEKYQYSISEVMQKINGGFSQKYNTRYGQRGHFWQARFKSKIILEIEHLLNTVIYFSLNPVRAGICNNPFEYQFSGIHSLHQSRFNKTFDFVDKLPKIIEQEIVNYLKNEEYLYLNKRVHIRRYSFKLSKNPEDQKYRYLSIE